MFNEFNGNFCLDMILELTGYYMSEQNDLYLGLEELHKIGFIAKLKKYSIDEYIKVNKIEHGEDYYENLKDLAVDYNEYVDCLYKCFSYFLSKYNDELYLIKEDVKLKLDTSSDDIYSIYFEDQFGKRYYIEKINIFNEIVIKGVNHSTYSTFKDMRNIRRELFNVDYYRPLIKVIIKLKKDLD